MPTKLFPLRLEDLAPTLILEKGHRNTFRTPAELQEIIDDCIHDMKDTTHLEMIRQCRTKLANPANRMENFVSTIR